MTAKRIFFCGMVWAFACVASAKPSFYTERLEMIACAVGVDVPDNLGKQVVMEDFDIYKGRPLKLKVNQWGDVSHIGYKLFDETNGSYDSMTSFFNFIERYFLELDLQIDGRTPEERIHLDKVRCASGNITMRHKVTDQTAFSVRHVGRRKYEIQWALEKDTLGLVVPADCQLIIGANAIELECIFERDVHRVVPVPLVCDWNNKKLASSEKENLVVNVGDYLSNEIRSDLYLQQKGEKLELLLDVERPVESIKNILLTGCFVRDIPLALTINRYGYKKTETSITLQQFVEYCRMEGCSMYVGIKKHTKESITATVFALNNALGYNHVLAVDFPIGILAGRHSAILGTSYVYIPLQNVTKDFFMQEIKDGQL